MANRFNGNVRISKPMNDDELRASLKTGWHEELPAIQDERGTTLVGNRRMRIAKEEKIEPVIRTVTFGDGPEAEAARIRLANVSNVGGSPMTAADRKAQAERLYESGLTMKSIAGMLGVSEKTISLDLNSYQGKNSKPTKTDSNPKGAGRPKTTKPKEAKPTKPPPPPKPVERKQPDDKGRVAGVDIKVNPDTWKTFNEQAQKEHTTPTKKIAELIKANVDPEIDPKTLSLSAQEKLERAIKQAERKIEERLRQTIWQELVKRSNDWLQGRLDQYNKNKEHYELVLKQRKGLMTKAEYRAILSCLHTDRYQHLKTKVQPEARQDLEDLFRQLDHAFSLFTRLEKAVLNEKDSPTTPASLPKTVAELMERAAKFKAEKAAQRAAKKNGAGNAMERR